MTEPATDRDPGTADDAPVAGQPVARDRSLTLPARRLRGSPACLNCGTPLQGPFCHYCGQPDRNLVRFFPVLMRELLADFIDFDSRFMRTMRPLLFHPGKLTRDYLEGRRFRYTPPLRLYIFSSAVFFILAAMLAGSAIDISGGDGIAFRFDTEEQQRIEEEIGRAVEQGALSQQDAAEFRGVVSDVAEGFADGSAADAEPPAGEETEADGAKIFFNDEPWDRDTNPLLIPGLPDFMNDWLNDEIAESPRKQEQIEQNPDLIIDQALDVMPVAIFVMLPFVALLFKFWYLFARRYYVEHLLHALHNHAFLFVVFTLTLLADSLAQWLDPSGTGRIAQAATAFTVVMLCWIPLYLLISLKTVYRQGWILTFAKFSVIGLSYIFLLAIATALVAVLSFLLL